MLTWTFLQNFFKLVLYKRIPSNKCSYKYCKYLKTNKLNGDGSNKKSELSLLLRQFLHKALGSAKELKNFAKSYWFVVLPLHGALTLSYMSFFYLNSKRHNVLSTLKWFEINENDIKQARSPKYLQRFSKKTLEDIAVTVILMKLSAPIRYTSTVIASKWFIGVLKRRNLINLLAVHRVNEITKKT